MKQRTYITTLVALCLGTWAAAEDFPVATAASRQASLETAEQLLAAKAAALPANAADPFHSQAFAEASSDGTERAGPVSPSTDNSAAAKSGPRGARDTLIAIANGLKPSGYIVLRGAPTLSFGQKRVKAGDPITINFEGVDYTLEIVAIDRTSFTLRLNREEYTRPIK